MRRAARGFTLFEVMIAITIMGVLALICWRALDSVANSDQRLRQADAENHDGAARAAAVPARY